MIGALVFGLMLPVLWEYWTWWHKDWSLAWSGLLTIVKDLWYHHSF